MKDCRSRVSISSEHSINAVCLQHSVEHVTFFPILSFKCSHIVTYMCLDDLLWGLMAGLSWLRGGGEGGLLSRGWLITTELPGHPRLLGRGAYMNLHKRWEYATEWDVFPFFFKNIYLNPPPIAAPTTILRQPLNVLYRTPVEAVKVNVNVQYIYKKVTPIPHTMYNNYYLNPSKTDYLKFHQTNMFYITGSNI